MIGRPAKYAILVSVLAHVLAGGLFLHLHVSQPMSFDTEVEYSASALASSGDGQLQQIVAEQPPADDRVAPQTVTEMLNDARQRAEAMNDQEKIAALDKKRKTLHAISSDRNVETMASMIEGVFGVDRRRAYAPRKDAEGTFDHASAIPYKVTKRMVDGKTTYELTYVDKAGRTLRDSSPEQTFSPQELENLLYVTKLRQDSMMGRLVDSAMKLSVTLVERQEAAARRRRQTTTAPTAP